MKKLLFGLAAALLATTASHAAIVPVLTSVTAEGNLFRYTYSTTLTGDQGVIPGSKLVIQDFAGFAGGVVTPGDIAFTTENTTSQGTADGQLRYSGFADDAAIENLVFTWTGAPFQTSGGPYAPITFVLSALSRFGDYRTDGYTAISVQNYGLGSTGQLAYNQGPTGVPVGGVPEPATWGLMLIGFASIGAAMRRSRRQQFAAAL